MSRRFRPSRVYETVAQELKTPILEQYPRQKPVWFDIVHSIPPAELLTRPVPIRHNPIKSKSRKPKNVYLPQKIVFPEDELRTTFFKDHPWELARPRIILESDGKDQQRCDWSKGPRQPGLQLTGECVVQRQMWLMENAQMSKDEAYDKARREFYALRQEEEVERRVAREEALHVGATFGPSRLQVSQDLEDVQTEAWKKWAALEIMKTEQTRSSAYAKFGTEGVAEDDEVDAAEEATPL